MTRHNIVSRLTVLAAGLLVAAGTTRAATPAAQAGGFRNLRVLADRSPGAVDAAMQAMNRALGVECAHCHVPDAWHLESKPAFGVARQMLRMVNALNTGLLKETAGVACWTCHAGETRPSRLPRASLDAELAKWPAALASAPESTQIGMAVYNVSLGVTCDHCHVAGDWKAATRPAFKTVATMNAMFEVFPKFMPSSARTQCYMCHKGTTSPQREPPARDDNRGR